LGRADRNIMAALWPRALQAMVSVSGYLIGSQEANARRCRRRPNLPGGTSSISPPSAAAPVTKPTPMISRAHLADGFADLEIRRRDLRPLGRAFDNPDHVASPSITIAGGSGWSKGEAKYDAYEEALAKGPSISVPTITMEGDANGAPHPEPSAYAGEVLRQIPASHHRRRHRPQPAAGGAARIRSGGLDVVRL
jgi:hypothetical protein